MKVTRQKRYIVCLAAVCALLIPATAAALPSLAQNPANKMLKRGIDPLQYDKATHCTGKVTAGAKALVAWLEKNSAGVNWGIYRCEKWGRHEASLHAEGRAIDWHLDAGNPAQKRAAYKLIQLLLAPDKDGNPVALARRMGVQGLIFDCQSWWGNSSGELGEYSYCYGKNGKRKKGLDRTQAHMDHVHIELNKRGAAKKTTFWNASVKYPVQDQTQDTTRRNPFRPQQQVQPQPQQPQQPQAQQEPAPSDNSHVWDQGGGSGNEWDGGGRHAPWSPDDEYTDPATDDWGQ